MLRLSLLILVSFLCVPCSAETKPQPSQPDGVATAGKEAAKLTWDERYQQLLKRHPDIRQKVERGGATKRDVIAWMKSQARGGKQKGKDYYGAKIQIKDPRRAVRGDGKTVYSGPQPGEALPEFQATLLRGAEKGKSVQPVARAGQRPQVLIFQDNSVVGKKGLLVCGKTFATIAKHARGGLHVSSTILLDEPTPAAVFDYDFVHEIDDTIELSLSPDRREGPGAYGLNRNVAMTILVARQGKVLHNFAFPQPMLYPDPHLLGAIAEAVGVDRTTMAGWFSAGKSTEYAMDKRAGRSKEVAMTTSAESEQQPAAEPEPPSNPEPAAKAGEADSSDVPRRRERPARPEYSREEAQRPTMRRERTRNRRVLEVKPPEEFGKDQAEPVFSGPQPGEALPSFEVTSIMGDAKGQTVEPAKLAGERPQILFLQDDTGVALRGLAGTLRVLGTIQQRSDTKLHTSCIFLTDDADAISRRFARAMPMLKQRGIDLVATSNNGRSGPGVLGLNRNLAQTILLVKDGKVTRNFVFRQGMLYPDPHVLGGIAELIGVPLETVAGWLKEPDSADSGRADRSMKMRDGRQPAMRGGGEQGGGRQALRAKLGQLVRDGRLSRAEAMELMQAAFPGKSDER